MIDETPLIHVGIERTFKNRFGYSDKVTINLSRIPMHASVRSIEEMMGCAQVAVDRLFKEADIIADPAPRQIDHSAFAPATYCDKCGSEIADGGQCSCFDQPASALIEGLASMAETRALGELPGEAAKPLVTATCNKCGVGLPGDDPFIDGLCEDCERIGPTMLGISEIAGNEEPEGGRPLNWIPDESEIRTGSSVFGCEIQFPHEQWNDEPITETGADGGAGQLTAVNAALSSAGYGGVKRHGIAQMILDAYGPIHGRQPTKVTSIRDLTKAEAHVVMSYFEKASPNSRHDLYLAAGKEQPCLI